MPSNLPSSFICYPKSVRLIGNKGSNILISNPLQLSKTNLTNITKPTLNLKQIPPTTVQFGGLECMTMVHYLYFGYEYAYHQFIQVLIDMDISRLDEGGQVTH